jgi:hypothetical protein
MRFAPLALLFLLSFSYPCSNGQTLPGSGPSNIKTSLPEGGPGNASVVIVHPESVPPSPEANHKRLLADLQALLTEAQALQHELQSTPGGAVSAQSLKRSQQIESLSKRIRKALKLN